MQILNRNLKNNEIKIKIDNSDDIWYLSHIIEAGDIVKGKTLRKIKIGDKEDRKSSVVKKTVFIEIETEKIEFYENSMKVLGKIKTGPEDVKKGSYHSFLLEEGTSVSIKKESWMSFQLDKLKEASETEQPNILICAMDREEAIFALSKRKGYEILSSIQGEVQKKDDQTVAKGGFYEEIRNMLSDYASRYNAKNIIVASPVFWKEELMKHIKDDNLKKMIVLAGCSSVSKNAIDEVMRRPEVKEVLRQVRTAKEMELVERLLTAISKKEPASYGIKEIEDAANSGAISLLLVSDSLIRKMRAEESYEKLDNIMKLVDSSKGEIHIIGSDNDAGKKLDGLGGIGGLLRYNID